MSNYTIDDLKRTRRDLEGLLERESEYTGNNPGKFESEIRGLVRRRELITADLKQRGLLPETDEEILTRRLDEAFPNAVSKQVVELEGRRYRKRYRPAEYSRSGKSVTRWEHWWEPVD
jgi:hypothetical protein